MNLDTIYNDAKSLNKDFNNYKSKKDFKNLSLEEFNQKMNDKYTILKNNFNVIFQQCITGHMDLDILSYMINQAKNVNNKKETSHNASVKVGQKLVDKLIKPNIDKIKKEKK